MDCYDVEGFIAGTAGGFEERLDLSGGEVFGLLPVVATMGALADCHVTGNHVISDRLRERHLEGGVEVGE